jgi:hypothetical protein
VNSAQTILVIVSYYAGRSLEPLVRLLDSMNTFPAGCAFAVRVVVNRNGEETIALPDRHGGVEILYRSNSGYNIAAWEFGWRASPTTEAYLFLQDDCRVVQSNWIVAFLGLANAGVGLVGECLSPDWDATWADLVTRYRGHMLPEHTLDGQPAERVECYFDYFRRHGIAPGSRGDHLQSLVLFARRAVLEAIGAEIGVSKRVQAQGLAIAEVGPEPFFYIEHPQWLHRRPRPNER